MERQLDDEERESEYVEDERDADLLKLSSKLTLGNNSQNNEVTRSFPPAVNPNSRRFWRY